MTQAELARQLIRMMPGAPARTLATRLRADYPQVFHSVEHARTSVRVALGVNGKAKRSKCKSDTYRAPRQAGQVIEMPESAAEPWTPFYLPAPGCYLSLSDLHIPYHDKRAIESAIRYAKRRHKITGLIINGDLGDYYQISRFDRNPAKRSLVDELTTQREALAYLQREFRRQLRVFKRGNHDERWDLWVWKHAPEIADLEHIQLGAVLKLAEYGFTEVGDEPIMAGKLPILHGHELGKGFTTPVGPARTAFVKAMHSVLVAHHHRTSSFSETDLWHRERMAWSQGCLCDLTPEYARINKYNLGFAVVDVAADEQYDVHNYRFGGDYTIRQS